MSRSIAVPITPEVLGWAVGESGHGVQAVAGAVDVDIAAVEAWIAGSEQPTLTQFRKAAEFLKRPEAVFFLPRPPRLPHPDVKFRHAPGAEARKASPAERLHIRDAGRLQRGMAWVLEEAGDLRSFRKLSTADEAEAAAAMARRDLAVSVSEQLEWESPFEAQRRWRAALERIGIAVLFLPMGGDAVRGFSLWEPRVPLIAVNTHWRAEARAFTLFHEYAHLLTRTSSMCAQSPRPRAWDNSDRIERWCEEFSAAFLVPWAAVESLMANRFGWKGQRISELGQAAYVARKLHVSLRAIVLRLVNKQVSTWSLYQQIPPASDGKPKGGPPTGGRRRPQIRVDEYGVRAIRTFLDGLHQDVLTRDDVLRYLDVADTEVDELEALTSAG